METVNEASYAGTQNNYHYLWLQNILGGQLYRVPCDEIRIDTPFPYTSDCRRWRLQSIKSLNLNSYSPQLGHEVKAHP